MARMFPERLPGDVESAAERRLFEQFATELSDRFTVFFQVTWLQKGRRGGAEDGEADFVVAHPQLGVLVVEVKGGGVGFDPSTGRWISIDRYGNENKIKDPLKQALRSMHALKTKLRDSELTRGRKYAFARAVVFPDIEFDPGVRVDTQPQMIIDKSGLKDLKQAVVDALTFGTDDEMQEPGDEGIEALVALLGRTWRIQMTLDSALERQEQVIRELTENQYQVLNLLGRQRRALISGCAGSGKTMLSIEKARRLAADGYRVLLTCFNKNLAHWMAGQLAGAGVTCRNFHNLCTWVCAQAGTAPEKGPDESLEQFFARLPDALLDAARKKPDLRFDAVIVDEGQDFEEEWWVALTELLEDPQDSVFYIFFDDNQRIYVPKSAFPILGPPFPLTENCRNTRQIHDVVSVFYQSDQASLSRGPDGLEPELLQFDPGDERSTVSARIDQLVGQEGVSPSEIGILTPRSRARSIWNSRAHGHGWATRWLGDEEGPIGTDDRALVCSSIYAFKGLERPVIIVSELSDVDAVERAELLYVAFSRARQHLIVAGLDGLDRLGEALAERGVTVG